MARHADLFNQIVLYPSTNYPGRTQENVLNSLLRKKLEPPIASWVEEGREIAANTESGVTNEKEQQEFAQWVREFIDQRVQKYALEEAGDNYTAEERELGIENVNTGLKRKFDDDDDDEDEDEAMEDVGLAITSVSKTATAVEFGMSEIKRDPMGKARTGATIWTFATTGMVIEPSIGRR
jgi:mediator of RNA polymerase II transcription subunit 8